MPISKLNLPFRMPVHDTNDAELRTLIFDFRRVVVKFTKPDCNVCAHMAHIFSHLSNISQFENILFLRMDAKENPVSSKEVSLSGTPFFATYLNGTLSQCSLVSEKETLIEMLSALQMAETN